MFTGEFLGVHTAHYVRSDGSFVIGLLANGMDANAIAAIIDGLTSRVP